jgi:hypothetical protein
MLFNAQYRRKHEKPYKWRPCWSIQTSRCPRCIRVEYCVGMPCENGDEIEERRRRDPTDLTFATNLGCCLGVAQV